jgi:mono/diheme cytochrome c family protein
MNKISLSMMSAAVSLVAACSAVAAQPQTIEDGVYTVEQAEAGKPLFEQRCSACHNADFYRGSLSNRNNQPLAYMFEEILVTMPADMPGSLMDAEYEAILAHILQLTGYPAGDAPLDYNSGTMHTVNIIPPKD